MAITRETLRQLRQLATTVGGHADDTTRQLTAAWVRAWDELAPAWQQAIADLIAKAAADGHWPPPWQLARMERLAAAVVATSTALDGLAAQSGITMAAGTGPIVAATATAEPLLIASQLPASLAAAAAGEYAAKLTPTALDVIVRRTGEQITARTRPLSAAATEAMRRSLIRGVAVGDNPNAVARDMVRRVEGDFSGGLGRAIVVARTEMLDAYREVSRYAHSANADVLDGWTWHSALDRRSCPACWSMHGREFPIETPGPLGHQQCVLPGAVVEGPRPVASTARWYAGEVVDVETDGGHFLSVTPNHPILTPNGWVAAGDLHEGSYVVCGSGLKGRLPADHPDDYQVPALIEDVAQTLGGAAPMVAVGVPTAAEDFHGDGAGSEVHVVRADGLLRNRVHAALAQPGQGLALCDRHVREVPASTAFPRLSVVDLVLPRQGYAPGGRLGCAHDDSVLFGSSLVDHQPVRVGHGTTRNPGVLQPPLNDGAGDAETLGQGVLGFAGPVAARQLVDGDVGFAHGDAGGLFGGKPSRLPFGSPEFALDEDVAQAGLAGVMASGGGFATLAGSVVGNGPFDGIRGAATLQAAQFAGRAQEVASDQLSLESDVPYPVPSRGGLEAFAGNVVSYRVLKISRRGWSGHVYNLQTTEGWYLANGIVTHNCRCTRLPKVKSWQELGINLTEPADQTPDARARFDALPEERQLTILGPTRLALLKAGRIQWADLATRRDTPGWRPSYAPTPVADLQRIVDRAAA
ncbi:hypothetical protein JNW88_00435 [Micromonospora sp. ATA32]|nr:hypothetical protein [Micromonospora sp. ATA32]